MNQVDTLRKYQRKVNQIKNLKEEYMRKWEIANDNYNELEQNAECRKLTKSEHTDYVCFIREATILVKIVIDLEELLK